MEQDIRKEIAREQFKIELDSTRKDAIRDLQDAIRDLQSALFELENDGGTPTQRIRMATESIFSASGSVAKLSVLKRVKAYAPELGE
jgi:hypothetical protein